MNLNVIRTWAFNDGERSQALQRRQGQLDENVLVGEFSFFAVMSRSLQPAPSRRRPERGLSILRSLRPHAEHRPRASISLAALDNVLVESAKRGIRLVLTLTNFWDDYGASYTGIQS